MTDYIIEDLRPLASDIGELQLDPENVRLHGEKNIDAIASSLDEFGQRKPIVARRDNKVVIAGNGTLEAARLLEWPKIAVVWVAEDPESSTRFAIADNRTAELATWDDAGLLALIQELDSNVPVPGFDGDDIAELIRKLDQENQTGKYTKKISPITYTPTRETPPALSELVDVSKTAELLDQIDESDVPDAVRDFLCAAAFRHAVFDFENIAEYYAHAEPELQRLMEASALVVIDFDSAIEHGFVQLTKRLAEIASAATDGEIDVPEAAWD